MSRLFRRCALTIQACFNDFDSAIAGYDPAPVDGEQAPIFLIGAPRSGSTLLYQVLLQQFRLAYISNIMALVPRHMVKLCRWRPRLCFGYAGELHPGQLGFVPGLRSPSEAGKVMDAWFREAGGGLDRERIRRTIAALSRIAGAPVLIKSPSLFDRLTRVQAAFPRCRFIHLKRDSLFVAQSILLNRRDPRYPAEQWRGAEPKGYAELGDASEEYRAVWQAVSVEREIDRGLRTAGDRVVAADYAAFCAGPHAALAPVGESFGLGRRADAPALPAAFPAADRIRVDDATWRALRAAYEAITAAR